MIPTAQQTMHKRRFGLHKLRSLWRGTRRIVITIVGITVITIGVCLLVLPGPGLLVIFGGVAVLALEFAWARRILHRCRQVGAAIVRKKEAK